MIHIEGRNISPFLPDDPHLAHLCQRMPMRYEMNIQWRDKLGDILKKILHMPMLWKDEEITSWFGHDPSVPTDPYPTAILIVRVPKSVAGSDHLRLEASEELNRAFRKYLNEMRGTTTARAEVYIDVV
ncbi:MAG: hypothetical protein WCW34_01915 [Patescibacteria group bacterium]